MRGLNPLQFFLLAQEEVEISSKLKPWIRTWWGEVLTSLIEKYLFEDKGDNLLWDPPQAASETSLELLLESQLQRLYKTHLMVVPQIKIFLWRNMMGEEVGFIFTVLVGMPFGGLGEHEPLIIFLFLTIVLRRNWKVPWNIHRSYWEREAIRAIEL